MKEWKLLYKSVRQYTVLAILTPILMVCEAVAELQIPNLISSLIDYLNESAVVELSSIFMFGLKLLGVAVLSLISGVLGAVTAARAGSGFAANLKSDMFKKIQSFSFTNIDKYHSSSLITRMTTDANWVQMCFIMTIRMAVRAPAIFIYAFIKALFIQPQMSFIFLITVPMIIVGIALIFTFAYPQFSKAIKRIDDLNAVVEEDIRGIRVVKSYTNEKYEKNKFKGVNDDIYKKFRKANIIVNFNSPLMMLAIYGVIILIAIFGTENIGRGLMSTGDLYALITYSVQILAALMMFSMVIVFFIISRPSQKRICEILNEKPSITNKENAIEEIKNGDVEFKNVYFKYNSQSERYVLNNINLKIKSGETVGILGTTGSSKSTLVSLIARLYDTTDGEILVGDEDIKDYDVKALRDSVSVVLQKNELFSGTIKENLKWGNQEATDEEIEEAAKISQSEEFILQMPNKYDTNIEQGGNNVSGGQKQRLCIARAILKKPKILILDDSMSAVDTKTDAKIRDGLRNFMPEITKIIVAQRCSSVMDADKIIILDDGEIKAIGRHSELLETSAVYQEVYYSQNQEGA